MGRSNRSRQGRSSVAIEDVATDEAPAMALDRRSWQGRTERRVLGGNTPIDAPGTAVDRRSWQGRSERRVLCTQAIEDAARDDEAPS